ncbi:cell division protein SepF [Streptococcus bovimastitidis]|uniref:Cell division protein SepF n=1 Tax=Streptococcus bovimastitidis TaxID=1856638 RepID=A0A1L8MMQ2_9STRE|nr:cell division protein SepF [Streptococcus bovimastitidis]OJF72054.1 cell division protein SepF [Streptococcus bovimastitidis]
MAFKDAINKMVSYFDTDDVSEVEDDAPVQRTEEAVAAKPQQQATRPNPQTQASPRASQQAANRPAPTPRSYKPEQQVAPSYQAQQRTSAPEAMERRSTQYGSQAARKPERQVETAAAGQTTIALKFPKKYEDAQEIVDLLIENECVLMDFQYMLDAQARRCLDFIDGASKVLYGSLQKVGSSMYLLTPSNVSVNIEEMNIPNSNQDFGYDFDMKRR